MNNQRILTKLIVLNYSCTQDCTDEVPCEGLDNHAHFKNFGFSMLTLFRVSTGDNWNGILKVFKFALILSLGVKSLFINRLLLSTGGVKLMGMANIILAIE